MKIEIDKDLAEFIAAMCRNNGISYKAYTNSLLEKAIQKEVDVSIWGRIDGKKNLDAVG